MNPGLAAGLLFGIAILAALYLAFCVAVGKR